MHTYDRLIDPKRRDITTTWNLDESTKDGQVVLTVETTVSKRRSGQVLVTDIYVQHLHPEGYLTRSFGLYQASVGMGIDLVTEPLPRYSAKKALLQHEAVLADLSTHLDRCEGHGAYSELRRLLDLALVTV